MSEAAAVIRARLLAALRQEEPGTPVTPPAGDGTWPDIDYTDRSVATWAPFEHVTRLAHLARDRPGQAMRALDAWLRLDPVCPNWWYNQLGVPRRLGDAALLLHPRLTAAQRERVGELLGRATWDRMTGQNLLWTAQVAIRRSLLAEDLAGLAEAFRRAAGLLVTTCEEGIQPDYSFHQHGAQLYSGGYGHTFAMETAALAALCAGTPLAFSGEALAVLSDFLLDGQRWMVHAGRYDITCMGRESSREGNAAHAARLASAARALADAGAPRADELRAFVEGGHPPTGTRAFWRSDYLAVHRPAWSAAVKVSSSRTVLSEAGNGEGLAGWHLCDGVCHLWRTGEEYHELWPVQDWRHLPGATVAYRGGPLPLSDFGDHTGGSEFAGVLSDGRYGMAAMHLRRDGVEARKAWFFFMEEFVALGTGITGTDAGTPLHTTIDQTALHGEVRHTAQAIHHNGVGYRFPEPAPVTIRAGLRSGSWAGINRSQSGRQVSARVLEMWIDHGPRPDGATYAYLTIPGIPPERIDEPRPVTVLANTPRAQAVRHGGADVTQIVFHRPGTLGLPGGDAVTVDRPILLQFSGASDIAAACPMARGGGLVIDARRGGKRREVRLDLPDGPGAGATVHARW